MDKYYNCGYNNSCNHKQGIKFFYNALLIKVSSRVLPKFIYLFICMKARLDLGLGPNNPKYVIK